MKVEQREMYVGGAISEVSDSRYVKLETPASIFSVTVGRMDKFNSYEAPKDEKGSSKFSRPFAIHCEGIMDQNWEGILDE